MNLKEQAYRDYNIFLKVLDIVLRDYIKEESAKATLIDFLEYCGSDISPLANYKEDDFLSGKI